VLSFWSASVQAQILFEGYSRITQEGNFIGFGVQRYEFDKTKSEFISTYMVKYNELGGSVTESLVAKANKALEPISYNYNMLSPKSAKSIDALFVKGQLKLTINDNGKRLKREATLPKGAFFSTFLAYVILQNPNGLKANANYDYQAVAEEDGQVYRGTAKVLSQETLKNIPVFKINNNFKDAQFTSYATDKGEIIATESPLNGLKLELVANAEEAVGGLSVSADNLRLLFGSVPEGKANALSALAQPTPSPAVKSATTTTLGAGVPSPTTSSSAAKSETIRSLEPQAPLGSNPHKQGTRKGKGIQTKSK
jgi:hypothetical protein